MPSPSSGLDSTASDNIRRLIEWSRSDDASPVSGSPPIENVGIIGCGVMGTAIAAAHLASRIPVVLCDSDETVLAGAAAVITSELRESSKTLPEGISNELPLRKVLLAHSHSERSEESPGFSRFFAVLRMTKCLSTTETNECLAGLLRTTVDPAEAARCGLVLEAIVETLPAKQRLFTRMQSHLVGRTIVATNTSTIPIERMAESVGDASRFCGMHFLHPVSRRPLVEIVRGSRTSAATIASAKAHVRRLGKMPIVVCDGPGFLVNRLLFPYLGEALEMLREGIAAEAIERAALEFGMALGPLRMIDEIGLDTTLQAGWVLAEAFPERILPSPLLVSMVKAGRLGQKASAGFYRYGDSPDYRAGEKKAVPFDPRDLDPTVDELLKHWIERPCEPNAGSIADRLILPMLLEAMHILEEGCVDDARAIDLAMLFGLGFPAARGGLLWWADALGPERILEKMRPLETLGPRFRPTPMLANMAKAGQRFING